MFYFGISKLNFAINKTTDLKACNFIKKRLQRRCFPENFVKFLITAFLVDTPSVAASDKNLIIHEKCSKNRLACMPITQNLELSQIVSISCLEFVSITKTENTVLIETATTFNSISSVLIIFAFLELLVSTISRSKTLY